MKLLGILLLFFYPIYTSIAQKSLIDTNILSKWPTIEKAGISDNGRFYFYTVDNKKTEDQSLFVLSDLTGWKMKIDSISQSNIEFSANSNWAIFINSKDILEILLLGTSSVKYIPHVSSFKLSGNPGNEWIAYLKNTSEKELLLQNLLSGDKFSIPRVSDYLFSNDGKLLVLNTEIRNAEKGMHAVDLVNLSTGKIENLWEGIQASNYVFDNRGAQLAFIARDSNTDNNAIYYYNQGMKRAKNWISNQLPEISQQYFVSNISGFSSSGENLFFTLGKYSHENPVGKPGQVNVNIWRYKDRYLQSEQLTQDPQYLELLNTTSRNAVTTTNSQKVFLLEGEGEYLEHSENKNEFAIVYRLSFPNNFNEREYKNQYLDLLSIGGNKRERILERNNIILQTLSPNERFVIWFDTDSLAYWSYEIATHTKRNISKGFPCALYDEDAVQIGRRSSAFGIAGWTKADDAVFLYDKYDIWQVDPRGIKAPINVTNYFGRKNDIVFGILVLEQHNRVHALNSGQNILSGFNISTKYNGFWKVKMNSSAVPEKGCMDPYCYFIPRVGASGKIEYPNGTLPIKAKKANKYLVRRMSNRDFPNLFVTRDFKSFRQISDLHPEREYNWLTAELVNWKMTDGKVSQGILYKPENFDSTKKYPLIFNYYEKRSHKLYEYLEPDFTRANLDIPYFVSNGYLVFVPDIYYSPGHNGQGVVNAIVSAAKYLSAFPWVDSTKLGLQGHSFGGWETNFLITHTDLFAAACEASGVSDQVSAYNQLDGWGSARQRFYEQHSQGSPYGIGVTPWTHPELYVENSPVFYADKVTTPLLMMHGGRDKAVPYEQAIEMFLSLKRAGKKVWLLQYEVAGHILWDDANARDFTIRLKQFFDHYLKDAPPPIWMTRGVPAKLKGIDTGLEMDGSSQIP